MRSEDSEQTDESIRLAKLAFARQRGRAAASSARVRSEVMARLSTVEVERPSVRLRYGSMAVGLAVTCSLLIGAGLFLMMGSDEAPTKVATTQGIAAESDTAETAVPVVPEQAPGKTVLTLTGRLDTPMRIAAEDGKLVIRAIGKSST